MRACEDLNVQRLSTLAAIEQAIWHELDASVRTAEHGWRVATLATLDRGRADARSVVLREVEPAARRVLFYTDARSPKVRHVEAHPEGTLLLWSRELGWQLRLAVTLEALTSGPAVTSRWARLAATPAAQDYLSPLPPGSVIERPSSERGAQGHFALVVASVSALDWTEIHPEGHRRAAFDAQGPRWLQP